MPVDLLNPKLFKPHMPTAIDRHFLFGLKFIKGHQFSDPKWPTTAITEEYRLMSNCLKKNVAFKKLELNAETHKEIKIVQRLKQECVDGRSRIKTANLGDVTQIRRILVSRKDLQRKYKSMPLEAIMESCDQETFNKRKENDRLKYQLQRYSSYLKQIMLEQGSIEDRIQYANEFTLQTEIDAKKLRKELNNSATRITAYKTITRCYLKMISTLERDDMYFESVLDALENDIIEQQNFIQQIILLGVPAIDRYKQLTKQITNMDLQARIEMKENIAIISNVRKRLLKLNKDTKSVVRNYNPLPPRQYIRTTPSMDILQKNIDVLEEKINEIRVITMSPDANNIENTLEHLFSSLDYFETKNKLNDKNSEILRDKYDLAKSQIAILKHNYAQPEADRIQTIGELKLEVKFQQKLREQHDRSIVNSGNILQILNFSLWNICDVLRHIGKKPEISKQEYPNPDLKLPLIKFQFVDVKSVPPILYSQSSKSLLALATEKITILVRTPFYSSKFGDKEQKYSSAMYHREYLKALEDDEGQPRNSGNESQRLSGIYESTIPDSTILTRVNIKENSSKIVEKNAKKDDIQ